MNNEEYLEKLERHDEMMIGHFRKKGKSAVYFPLSYLLKTEQEIKNFFADQDLPENESQEIRKLLSDSCKNNSLLPEGVLLVDREKPIRIYATIDRRNANKWIVITDDGKKFEVFPFSNF